jgi:tetratricopeptide (TPR) repeat protein
VLAALTCAADAQTYQVGPGASKSPQGQSNQAQPPAQSADQSLGWGSNIQNARLARAAQMAIERGDHALALDYAQRAAKAAPNDPQLWFLLGYAARLDGKYQQSVDAYTHGLRLNPSSLDGTSGLAQDYNLMGRRDDAERLLKQVISSDPRRRNDLLLLGDISMRSKDYTSAVDWLSKAERLQPDARSELLLALSYQQLKKMDLASRYLDMAERRAPNNPDVQRSLAGYYREVGKYPEAIAALKSIRNPKPDVMAELAYTYQLDGKMNDSAELYAKAANAMPSDLGLQLSAAQAQVAAGSIGDASPFLKRAEGLNAGDYRLHAIRGEIAQLQERDQDAVTEYKAAVANLPATPAEGPLYGIQLHMDLVALYRNLGDESAAHGQLETAQSEIGSVDGSGPDREPFLRLRALIRMNAGDLDGALSDVKAALAMDDLDRNDLQLDGDILMKLGRTEDAIAAYRKIVAKDPDNRFALTSLGYASRAAGRDEDAERYFKRLAQADPSLYIPYLALGDLYTARREFTKAQASYSKGYEIAPRNALIVAGGMNAAIEAHNLTLAGDWSKRVTGEMQSEPQILRERERYLSFEGKYTESAEIGRKAMKVLPKDRDVAVYLGYDLLHLDDYDELLSLTTSYLNVLPKEADIPLLEGYVHKHEGLNEQALQDFTEALKRDPTVVTAYVNRGYVLNDLHQPQAAAQDFESALKREPNNGEAHLGLAYADLDLHKPQAAVHQADLAERASGDSRDIHVIRATAFGNEDMLAKAATEYRAALRFTPNDGGLHLALANTLFSERMYRDAVNELEVAEKSSPQDPEIYALLARSYANLNDRDQTLHNVDLAEQSAQSKPAEERSGIFVSTGEALDTLGDQKAAMDRFRRALEAAGTDRIGVRLAIAQLMAQQGHSSEAERQIGLGWMEAAAGDAAPPTGPQFIAAADVFRTTHDYDLSQTYLQRAKTAGAPDPEVRIGLADNYLALGDTARAQAELNAVSATGDSAPTYQYLLAEANVFRQEHQGAQALTSFAQASNAEGDDETAEQSMLAAGGDEGLRVTPYLSLLSDLSVEPIYEDSTVYVLDSKLDATAPIPSTDTSKLPPPRSSIQTQWTDAFHLHIPHLPTSSGFFQLRNARGLISVPATNSVVNRNTTDYSLNYGVNPTVHIGDNSLTFDAGIQGTFRRDSLSPVQMNQNLFRAFAYVSSSSFFNVISFSGYVIHEAGPFTESNLHSRSLTGAVDFRVGAPWGKTTFVTGWGMSDQLFSPVNYEDYYTSAYAGIEHRFSPRVNFRAIAEDLRAWRTVGTNSGIAQDLRPAGTIDFMPRRNWNVQISSAYSSTRGFHVYDAVQNGFSLSYVRPFHRKFNESSGPLDLAYPIRISAGMQQETFFNFTGAQNEQFRPYVEISIF